MEFRQVCPCPSGNLNELALLGEPVADFLEQISAPSLTTAKENVIGDVAKLEDFHTCQQYLKQVLLSQNAHDFCCWYEK
jgi:hypothetical protein